MTAAATREAAEAEIAGMAEHHTGALLRAFSGVVQSVPDERLTHPDEVTRTSRLFRALVGDALREAYYRGAAMGMAVASAPKYIIVTEAQMARIEEKVDDGPAPA